MMTKATALLLCLMLLCAGAAAEPSYDPNYELKAKSAIVMDADTGVIYYERSPNKKAYPASTTKIMTCLLALENCAIDEEVTIPKRVSRLPKDSSLAGVKPGDRIPLRDLLYGLMLASGNDAAVAIAVHVSGSEKAFVSVMNRRAQALGCEKTHFVNSHGYPASKHVSSAYDLALIARAAMQNPDFRQIAGTLTYEMPPSLKRKKPRTLTSTNLMLDPASPFYDPTVTGIKTGHHKKAGYCFIGSASRDGLNLITVVLGSTEKGCWRDTKWLIDLVAAEQQTSAA